jgi:hypothetical protein
MNALGNIAAELSTASGGDHVAGWYRVNKHAGGTLSVAPH